MAKLSEYVPKWMKPLEGICNLYYKEQVTQPGWILPHSDALGVLAFAYLTTIQDKKHRIPVDVLQELNQLIIQIKSMSKAFDMEEENVHVAKA